MDLSRDFSHSNDDTQAKYPTCGIALAAKSSRGSKTTGKTIGCLAPEKAGSPYVSTVCAKNWHFRFNPASFGDGRTKHYFEDPGTALRPVQVQHIGHLWGLSQGKYPSSLFRLENGQQSITLKKLQQILGRLRCSIQDIFPPQH
jgi:hypothetical protein